MIISKLNHERTIRYNCPGACANCSKPVFESSFILDDCYNVWAGLCPHCGAHNLLSLNHGLRGYDSQGMHLVLPTEEEKEANDSLPKDCPSQGRVGREANIHGSNAGEIYHILKKPMKKLEIFSSIVFVAASLAAVVILNW